MSLSLSLFVLKQIITRVFTTQDHTRTVYGGRVSYMPGMSRTSGCFPSWPRIQGQGCGCRCPGGCFPRPSSRLQCPVQLSALGEAKTTGANVTRSPENVQTVDRVNRYPDQYALGLVQTETVNPASHVISGSTLCLV